MTSTDLKSRIIHRGKHEDDTLLNQLENDCREMYRDADQKGDKDRRVTALLGLEVVNMRKHTVSRDECNWNHRSRIDWRLLLIALPGVAASATLMLQIIGII